MKILLKTIIVWLMLLAIPFQGFASATMLFCAPMQSADAVTLVDAAPAHDHSAMLAAERADAHSGQHDAAESSSTGHHDGHKCNSCATCYFGASMAPSHASRMPAETQHFSPVPFDQGFVPAVDLAQPERPPQFSPT